MSNAWKNNKVQFPRLLAEINASGKVDYDFLMRSMDLTRDEIDELFDRAEEEFQKIKDKMHSPSKR